MEVLQIEKTESKLDSKGGQYLNSKCRVLLNGYETSCFISSYVGAVVPGQIIDDALVQQKTSQNGRTYNSVWLSAPRSANAQASRPPAAAAPYRSAPAFQPNQTNNQAPRFTPEETDGLMEHSIDLVVRQIGKLAAFNVPLENISAIINTLFMEHAKNGHKPGDWKPATPITGTNESMFQEIESWIDAGLLTSGDVKGSIQLQTKSNKLFRELDHETAVIVYNKMKRLAAETSELNKVDFNATPVDPSAMGQGE